MTTATDTFPATQNPIAGNWSGPGTPWVTCETTGGSPGHATGINSSGTFDAVALYTGLTFGNDQHVTGTVYRNGATGSAEVELHCRGTFISGTPNQVKTYEYDWYPPNGIAIVRWNGPNGNVTIITNVTNTQNDPLDGVVIEAIISGSGASISVTAIQSGVTISSGTDSDGSGLNSGTPGMGFDAGNTTDGANYGLKGWSATDGVTGVTYTNLERHTRGVERGVVTGGWGA